MTSTNDSPGPDGITRLHGRIVFRRRVRQLTDALSDMLPAEDADLLDVGCGDGTIAKAIADQRPGLTVFGADVLARPEVAIPMKVYDGQTLPFPDNSFDAVMLVDVLHHCDDPNIILAEVARVARRTILIKDHIVSGPISRAVLRFMDWTGNRGHGVRLVYNFWSGRDWQAAWDRHGLIVAEDRRKLRLYPAGSRWLWERGKHFIARLSPARNDEQ